MKRLAILFLIVIGCMSLTVSCTTENDKTKSLLFPLFTFISGMTFHGDTIVHEVIFGPSSITATGGEYTDKVGVNWELRENAVSYNVYRSTNSGGPFTLAANVAADSIDTTPGTVANPTETPVEPPDFPDPPTTPPTTQAEFISDVNLNQVWVINFIFWKETYYGVRVDPGQNYRIKITLSGVEREVQFTSGLTTSYYTQTEVVSKINNAFGSIVCFPVNSGDNKYIKLVATNGSIKLENITCFALDAPLNHFLKSGSNWLTTITVNPVPVNTDTTPPTVMTTYPAAGATNIALNAKVWALFSEAVNVSTVTSTSFTLKKGTAPVAGAVTSTAVFTPSAELEPTTTYTATLTTAITDMAGNHLTSTKTWSFTTGGAAGVEENYCYEDTSANPEGFEQGTHYFYYVTSVLADGTESVSSPTAEGYAREISIDPGDPIPGKVTGCSATDGASGKVTVTWSALADADYYKVYRTSGSTTVQVGGNITGTSYEDSSVLPGLYTYRVSPFNSSNQEGIASDPDTGFRSVTNDEFFSEVLEENAYALNQIQHLKASGMDMLGQETVYDADGDGTCFYKATATLSVATIELTFTNFCGYYLTQNTAEGEHITTSLDNPTSKNGLNGTMIGTLFITGIYNGYVRYDLELTHAYVSGGNYWVSQNGGAETAIPWDSPLVPAP